MDVAVAGELAAVVSEQCAFDRIAGGDARDCVDKSVFESAVVESINSLRQQVDELRSVVRNLKTTGAALSQNTNGYKLCSLYVRVQCECGGEGNRIGKSVLEALLGCQISQYVHLVSTPFPSYKVRIRECDVDLAVKVGKSTGCFVAKWCDKRVAGHQSNAVLPGCSTLCKKQRPYLNISCWNCRGLSSSLPYIETLIENGSKILVLSEHWLWPYEIHKLNEINCDYEAVGKSDSRLTEIKDGGRGCGGIGLLWHKSVTATPISGITSDRICGIRCMVDDGENSLMSVIGVYLPCLDQGVDCYREHMKELERVISESRILGPVTVLGDFNAHLGSWECQQNMQGMLLQEMIERCDLNAVSQGILASGPGYTYCSGNVKTTVDYILMDIKAASMMTSCLTHPMEDLNTSDHLPLTVSLSYDVCSDGNTPGSSSYKKIDWLGAEKNGDLAAFSAEITSRLETLYNRVYDDAGSISSEIE